MTIDRERVSELVGYLARRVLLVAFVLWAAVTLAYVALQLAPGDPAQTLLAASGATEREVAARRAQLGLDEPPLAQYARYLTDLLRGRLGVSWLHGRPVAAMIGEQLLPTATLALAATVLGTAFGVGLGALAAVRRGTWLDTLATALAAVGLATPTYWSGLLAMLVFALYLGWLPASGAGDLRHLVLPAAVLGFSLSGSIMRLVRVRVGEVLDMPFVTAARARGLPGWRILTVHVFRTALGPALTVVALQLGFVLGGAVVTEAVFSRPGLGRLLLDAILWRDLPVVRGVIVVTALAYATLNLTADLLLVWLDPRLRDEITT